MLSEQAAGRPSSSPAARPLTAPQRATYLSSLITISEQDRDSGR